jgi:hypothetical protein
MLGGNAWHGWLVQGSAGQDLAHCFLMRVMHAHVSFTLRVTSRGTLCAVSWKLFVLLLQEGRTKRNKQIAGLHTGSKDKQGTSNCLVSLFFLRGKDTISKTAEFCCITFQAP